MVGHLSMDLCDYVIQGMVLDAMRRKRKSEKMHCQPP